jgi:hypothetical protein
LVEAGGGFLGGQVGIVDAVRGQFLNHERHAPETRFAPIVGQRSRQVFGYGQRPGAFGQTGLISRAGEARRQDEGIPAQRLGMRLEIAAALQRRTAQLLDGGVDGQAQGSEVHGRRARQ